MGGAETPYCQPPAGEPGCAHRVSAPFQDGEEDDTSQEWDSGLGQGQFYHIPFATANHRVSANARDGETDPDSGGGAQ